MNHSREKVRIKAATIGRCIVPELPPGPGSLSTEIMDLQKIARWSELTILLANYRAWCRHENHPEGSAGGSLPHVRRESRRKVRAQHRTAPYRTASRPPPGGFGEVKWCWDRQATTCSASGEPRRWRVSFTKTAATALSLGVGVEIWSNPCRPRFGGGTKEFWCCITDSKT